MRHYTIIAATLLLCLNVALAQQRPAEIAASEPTQSSLGQFAVLNQLNSNTLQNISSRRLTSVVQQIGRSNNVNANIRAYAGEVGYLQFGSNNDINTNHTAGLIDQGVVQIGANNNVLSASSRATLYHSTRIFQRGADQNLIMQGNNNMSQKMIVNMRGPKQTVLIRNFR